MSTATQYKTHSKPHENWQQQPDVITPNQVINAYLKGKKAGRTEMQIAIRRLFESNLEKAKRVSETLYAELVKIGIPVDSIHLKADSATDFTSLIIVSTKDFVDEKLLGGIRIGKQLKDKVNNSDFYIVFLYTHNAETLNESHLESDGYFMKYYAH